MTLIPLLPPVSLLLGLLKAIQYVMAKEKGQESGLTCLRREGRPAEGLLLGLHHLATWIFLSLLLLLFSLCVRSICEYVHVNTSVCGSQSLWVTLELELQTGVSYLKWEPCTLWE